MSTKKLANIFLVIGAVLTALTVAWWGVVFTFVGKQTGESLMSSFHCLYSVGDSCNFLRGMAWMQGMTPYEPAVFWLALVVLGMAIVLKRAISKDGL